MKMPDNKEVLNAKEPLTSQQEKKSIDIEMFRAGPQISSTGQKLMFTEEDLDQVVGTYAPGNHEAPLIIGHDQSDGTPALGWVKNLWRKGKALWGNVELTPKAEKLIRDGVFKKVSSSFYLPEAETNPHPGKLALRHLGLVSIPAVKGLTAFSEGELNEEKIVNLNPEEGETTISFKEALETNQSTMTRKKKLIDKVKEVSVDQTVDHAEGSMTVNINIGGGKPSVYDDNGNQVDETGAPADYKMEYADKEEEEEMAPEAPAAEGESDDMGLEEDGEEGGMEAPEASDEEEEEAPAEEGMGDEEGEGEEPAGGEGAEDISDEMEDNDKKIASLAAEYDEDELFQALALKKQASSMMEKEMSSYGEMPEGLKKHMEEKEGKEGMEMEEEDEEEKKKKEADHAEDMMMEEKEEEEEKKEEEADHAEDMMMEEHEDKEEEDKEKEKSEMSKKIKEEGKEKADHAETAEPMATESLDHSESAIGDQSIENLNARVAELEEEPNRQRKLAREKEISSFAEGLYESGKLTEQVVPKGDLVRFMETLNHKNSVNFSETGKASQFDFMRGVLESLPSMVSFEEFATPATAPKKAQAVEPNASGYVYDPNTADVHAEALSYAEQNGCDYLTAVKFVINNN